MHGLEEIGTEAGRSKSVPPSPKIERLKELNTYVHNDLLQRVVILRSIHIDLLHGPKETFRHAVGSLCHILKLLSKLRNCQGLEALDAVLVSEREQLRMIKNSERQVERFVWAGSFAKARAGRRGFPLIAGVWSSLGSHLTLVRLTCL